jgi:uncharacterized OsmC-like protein
VTESLPQEPAAERIKTALERNIRAVERMPSVALKTAVSKTRIVDGLRCEVEEGRWKVVADLHEKSGGAGAGPDPGVLGRAALGSCLAMGYVLWAAKLAVPVHRVEVDIEADFDARGQYGVADVPAGYLEVRYAVSIESPAAEADVLQVIETADRCSAYHDVFSRAQKLVRTVHISTPTS